MTKLQMRLNFWKMWEEKKVDDYLARLKQLRDQKRITNECYDMECIYNDHYFQKFLKCTNRTKKAETEYYIRNAYRRIRSMIFDVEEQENIPSQMQQFVIEKEE